MKFFTPEFDKNKVTVKQTYNDSGTKVIESKVIKIDHVQSL